MNHSDAKITAISELQAIEIFEKLVYQVVGHDGSKGVTGTLVISPYCIDEMVNVLIENDPNVKRHAKEAGVDNNGIDLQSELSQHAHFQYAQCVVEAKRQFESITSARNLILGNDEKIYVEKHVDGEMVITEVVLHGQSLSYPKPVIGEKLAEYYKRCTN